MGSEPCLACEASNVCLFCSLPEEGQARFCAILEHRAFAKGTLIFEQGEAISGCHLLCWGKVKLMRRTPQGKKQLIQFLHPGDLFGESAFCDEKKSSVYARTLEKSVIAWLSQGGLLELMGRYPELAFEINRRLARSLERLRIRLTEQSYERTRERLIGLLLELGTEYGLRSEEGLRIDLKVDQGEFAALLGNTREWICKQLGILQSRGLIAFNRGEVVIVVDP